MATDALTGRVCEYVDAQRDTLAAIAADLVRIPSENTPPVGAERSCQERIAAALDALEWDVRLYEPTAVSGVAEHPLFWPGRDYRGRPNVAGRRKGTGGGRSLVLSGHIDTVPRGSTQEWTRNPFGGEIEGNRLYGRGSNDMKSGVATNLFVAEAIDELGLQLAGDLVFETVVDEEFGGVNGTLAGRLAGYNGDAAVISEPSFLRICAAQRGGRTAHITFAAKGGVLTDGAFPAGVVDQLGHFLGAVKTFAAGRRGAAPAHPLYSACPDPVPVSIMKIFTGPWGMGEPMTVPEACRVEMFWQAMPGEAQADVDRQFAEWFEWVMQSAPELYRVRPRVEFPIRWLPGSAISPEEPLVQELSGAARDVLGAPPPVAGIEGPCDMYVFHQFGIPAVLWGARGGNTHAADEYVELDSVAKAAKSLLLFICRWCGARAS